MWHPPRDREGGSKFVNDFAGLDALESYKNVMHWEAFRPVLTHTCAQMM